MKTLCLDTAHKYLVIGIYEDGTLLSGIAKPSWKNQSETIFPELIQLCEEIGIDSNDINEVIITDGPGSYTGVRIAMSIAKVLCTRKDIPLYAISTLQLYAGLDEDAMVLLDARSKRAYYGILSRGKFLEEEKILTLDEIKEKLHQKRYHIYGDADLIEEESMGSNFLNNFIALKPFARRIDNVHTLVPRYLKEQEAYKVISYDS